MYTVSVLHKLLIQSAPSIHSARLCAVMAAVESLTQGAKAAVTSLGRGLRGYAYDKHKIKRMDRLLSNHTLYQERHIIYKSLTRQLLGGLLEPVILIDWSPLCADQSWQLLRAALPVGGRSLTLYEEVHPRAKLANRKVQHQFLDQLAAIIPDNSRPIIVADSGFRTPFYSYIESTLQWHWVGRIRGCDFLCWDKEKGLCSSAKLLYSKATTVAKNKGNVAWTMKNQLAAFIVLVRQSKKKRSNLTLEGVARQSKQSKVHATREREPWLLVASLSLQPRTPKQIENMYRTRMQIEEGFRDCKAVHYGLGLSQHRHMNEKRRAILCLLAALANFVLWCIGTAGKQTGIAKQVRVNSSSKRETYSVIFLARLLISQPHFRLSERAIRDALNAIKIYSEALLCP